MIWLVLMVIVKRTRRQGYEGFIRNCQGAIMVVIGGNSKRKKKFVTHAHWLCTLPHTIYCSGGEREKKKKESCLKCLITTSPLTEWTICKVFLSANSSSCHISTSFPASLALAIDFSRKADRGWINKRALIAVDKPCPTVMCKLPYPCLPSLVVIEYVLLS